MLSAWASRANGGVFEAVLAHVDMLRQLGAVPVVFATHDSAHLGDRWRLGDVEMHVLPARGPYQFAYGKGMQQALDGAELDLLHLHGIWQFISHAAGRWQAHSHRPLIISPHGMLEPWITRRNKLKKDIGRLLWERRSWNRATAFHALTMSEARDIAQETGKTRIATIPNAAPPLAPSVDGPPSANILFLGRIHQKKNVFALIAGWVDAYPHLPPGSTLTIAGWGDDERIAMLERALTPDVPSIQFVGTAFGSQKAALLDTARFLILPSLSEGLPMAILDAWSHGTPTLMSEFCHLPEGFAAHAALDVGIDRESIARTLVRALTMPQADWREMSANARALAGGPFSRETVATSWERTYADLLAA